MVLSRLWRDELYTVLPYVIILPTYKNSGAFSKSQPLSPIKKCKLKMNINSDDIR